MKKKRKKEKEEEEESTSLCSDLHCLRIQHTPMMPPIVLSFSSSNLREKKKRVVPSISCDSVYIFR